MKTNTELEIGEQIDLQLEKNSKLGDTIATYRDITVHVMGGISGEKVKARIIGKRKEYIIAQVVEVISPSPQRVQPPCKYYGQCTGCQWQHIDYKYQLEMKRQAVQYELDRILQLHSIKVSDTLPSPNKFNYRNHARFTIKKNGALGFVNRGSRQFVRIDNCMIMHPGINQILDNLQGKCEETTQLSIRYGINTDEWLIQPTLQNPDIPVKSGQTHYEELMMDRKFRVAASSFFQVNTPQAEQVVNILKAGLNLTGKEILVDAYAGVGTFAALLAPYCKKVIAIEESASAVKDAAINTLGINNLEFLEGKTEAVLNSIEYTPEAVILDPPRAGCHAEALDALKTLSPKRVCYVSCDPSTLARDLSILCEGNYQIQNVQPIDMFPQTYHTECIVTMQLKDNNI